MAGRRVEEGMSDLRVGVSYRVKLWGERGCRSTASGSQGLPWVTSLHGGRGADGGVCTVATHHTGGASGQI